LEIIFDRFKQLEEPQLSGAKGFGLGLSIVKQLTWLNLGTVDVQSEPGKGSTFGFTLPGDDLSRLLKCFIESIRFLEQVGEVRMLRIRSTGDANLSMLRRVISSCCYPMDLVLDDPEGNAVNAVGISRDAEAWSNRLREATARVFRSIGQQAVALEFEAGGSWSRDSEKTLLHSALLEALGARRCHV
jgi:hypothetical protein